MLWAGLLAGALMATPPTFAGQRTLRVLATTDMHGAMAAPPIVEQAGHPAAGLLRTATLIRAARAENPANVLVDGGDFAAGTLESSYSGGLRMAEAIGLLGYDSVTLGNHEFDWGVPAADKLVAALSVPVLAANFSATAEDTPGLAEVRPYVVKDVEGLRVAIVGLATPNLPRWFRDFTESGLRTAPSVATIEALLPELRRLEPDIMILVAHQGLMARDDEANEINAIGALFPDFDLVLGGHLHWALPGAKVGRVDYGQAGAYAEGVLQVDLVYDDEARAVVSKEFRLLSATPETPVDAQLAALFREDLERAAAENATSPGAVARPMGTSQTPPALSPVQQLFAKALMAATGAQAAFHGTFNGERLLPGPVTVRDLWRICPYDNRVAIAWLTKDEIRRVAEEALQFSGTVRYAALSGLLYDLYPNAAAGKRVRNIRAADGAALNGRKRIPVAFGSYLASGAGGRHPVLSSILADPATRLEIRDLLIRDAVAAFLRANDPVDLPSGTDARVFRRERRLWERVSDFESSIE